MPQDLLGKRTDNIISNTSSPFKKQKISNINYTITHNIPSLISCSGDSATLSLSNDKILYSFGVSRYNAHGFNEKIDNPKQIPGLENIKMISCGSFHSCCLDYNGNVFTFGDNINGNLGAHQNRYQLCNSYIPIQIDIPRIRYISCGNSFTICVTDMGYLYSFGSNRNGELGIGTNVSSIYPQQISNLYNVEYIECGFAFTICKTYNNEFYSWGCNRYGQLGQGNNNDCNKPIQCLNWPDNIISIKSGNNHSLLLTSEGQVYSFGSNYCGELGLNDKDITSINIPRLIKDIPEIKRIECADNHSMCIDINDNLWLFGNNSYGQLGFGDKKKRFKPTKLENIQYNIIDISSGGYRTIIKTSNNKIYGWGNNNHSQLRIKTSDIQLTPIQIYQDIEYIWGSNIGKNKQKSARK